jgi:hypothetical protein
MQLNRTENKRTPVDIEKLSEAAEAVIAPPNKIIFS